MHICPRGRRPSLCARLPCTLPTDLAARRVAAHLRGGGGEWGEEVAVEPRRGLRRRVSRSPRSLLGCESALAASGRGRLAHSCAPAGLLQRSKTPPTPPLSPPLSLSLSLPLSLSFSAPVHVCPPLDPGILLSLFFRFCFFSFSKYLCGVGDSPEL